MPQRGETRCDVLVIGAGWMGLHAARRYGELAPDQSVVLVDAGRIGNNSSGRCMGFCIDLAHNPRKHDFVEDIQGNKDELYTNLDGNAYLRSAVENLGVECDWDPQGKYHSAATDHGVADLVAFSRALDAMGQTYRWVERDEMREMTGSRHYIKALHHPGTILIQPAKYLKNMARKLPPNVTVHENTTIATAQFGPQEHVFETPSGAIRARKVIICASGYLTRFGFYRSSAIPVYTFASMTRELTEVELAKAGRQATYGMIPANSFGTTVRRAQNRLFLRNVYSYASQFRTTRQDVESAREQQMVSFQRRWPELASMGFETSWGGLLTLSGMPEISLLNGIVGQLARRYNLPWRTTASQASSKTFDAQSGYESATASLNANANFLLHAGGWDEAGMVHCLQKLVVDGEQRRGSAGPMSSPLRHHASSRCISRMNGSRTARRSSSRVR
jgi:glycine/D-amino acid oxidase-like deaminating enzyme